MEWYGKSKKYRIYQWYGMVNRKNIAFLPLVREYTSGISQPNLGLGYILNHPKKMEEDEEKVFIFQENQRNFFSLIDIN